MAFTNTVEIVGDEALTNSIIDRSITELHDNISTSIGQYALRGCAALTNVNFPSVTSTGTAAMYQCTALAKADFASAVAFGNNTFYGCSALTALILRNTDAVCTLTGNLSGTPIASGTGYIYVPAALVDTYKAASGWSTYAAQIRAIEDYVGVVDPYSWAGVAANIADGSYASVYSIGDLVPLDLGSEGAINMEIVAFDTDPLADGSGKAPISWISKELLVTVGRMNSSATTLGGWEATAMRSYLQETVLPLIPEDTAGMIQTVTKYTGSYDADGNIVANEATSDKLWIPSRKEVNTSPSNWSNETSAPCYSEAFSTYKPRMRDEIWWLRSAKNETTFYYISASGTEVSGNASYKYSIALGFCT